MNLEQAKIICLAHIEYVLNGTKNDYTPTEIGIAIDCIVDNLDTSKYFVEKLYLMKINQWRRGEIEIHPFKSTSRAMELVTYCVDNV